jgi:hypothetical protein
VKIAASGICLIPIHFLPISAQAVEKVRTLSLMRIVTIPTSVYAIPPSIMLDVRPETALWERLWERYGNELSLRTLSC